MRGGIVLLVVAAVMVYAYPAAHEFQQRMDCCGNLKLFYAGKAALEDLHCPRGGGYHAAIRPAIHVPFPTIIAFEPLSNHGGDGGAVLFSDGHAEFLMKGSYESRFRDDEARIAAYLQSSGGTSLPRP